MTKINGSNSFAANAATMIIQSFVDPRRSTTIVLPSEPPVKMAEPKMAFDQALRERPPITLPPIFKATLIVVTVLTVGAALGAIVMAAMWSNPTSMQQSIFDAMGTGWKMGFGAIVGLLGGKQINGGD